MEVQYKYSLIDGEFHLPTVTKENLDDLRAKFKGRADDVTVVTYPKSGTTWMQHIVKLIRSGGIDDPKVSTIFPWMDVSTSSQMEAVQSPRYMLSHFKYGSFPGGLEPCEVPGKFIYVARNPKDVAVSYYHHTHAFEVYEYNGDWNDFFSRFFTGEICEGDWFDHVLGWWKHQDSENIMFIKYEDMKKDLKTAISQVADFIGYDLDQATIDRIYEQTTFKSMKNNPNTNFTTNSIYKRRDICQEFIRKGIIGDWMTMFTVAQSQMFDEKYQRVMKGSGLTFDFGNGTY